MRRSALTRHTRLARGTKPLRPSGEGKRKRRARYKVFLSSAAWKRIRLATFELDGWRCTATLWRENVGAPDYMGRCPFVDETHTGKDLVCDHVSYARFGGDEIPGRDTRTRCKWCDRRLTPRERINWSAA